MADRDNTGKFVAGHSGGRPKGTPNKNTSKIRDAFQRLIETNLDNMTEWLEKVAESSPKEALDILNKMAEYTTPKLARVETKHEVDEGITKIELEFVKPKD